MPLIHQIANGRDDQRAASLISHDAQCNLSFTCTRRHYHHTSAVFGPSFHGIDLFGTKFWQADV